MPEVARYDGGDDPQSYCQEIDVPDLFAWLISFGLLPSTNARPHLGFVAVVVDIDAITSNVKKNVWDTMTRKKIDRAGYWYRVVAGG